MRKCPILKTSPFPFNSPSCFALPITQGQRLSKSPSFIMRQVKFERTNLMILKTDDLLTPETCDIFRIGCMFSMRTALSKTATAVALSATIRYGITRSVSGFYSSLSSKGIIINGGLFSLKHSLYKNRHMFSYISHIILTDVRKEEALM